MRKHVLSRKNVPIKLKIQESRSPPLLIDALLQYPTEQAMHHTHSAQSDHQAGGRELRLFGAGGNSGVGESLESLSS